MKLPYVWIAAAALAAVLATAGFSSARKEWAWVGEHDGSKSCEPGSGKAASKGVERLKGAGVQVEESRKGDDGMMYSQVCGGKTGTMNLYRIPKESVAIAVQQGFKTVEAPPEGR